VTDVESAYGACARIARAHSENFPTASRLLPARLSRHLAAFYAFARAGDDWADEPGHGDAAERHGKLHAWRARLHAPPDGHPVFVALAASRQELGLDTGLFDRLLDAFERDLDQPAYDTWDDLLTYCRDSAEPVGRLVLRAAGDRDEANGALSDRLCTALQLTNFWQDLSRDEPRGRAYLPRHERAELGDARALAWAIARTRRLFDDAAPLAGRAPRPLRAWLRAVEAGGRAVLERVDRLGPRRSACGRRWARAIASACSCARSVRGCPRPRSAPRSSCSRPRGARRSPRSMPSAARSTTKSTRRRRPRTRRPVSSAPVPRPGA
jgi:squalene synthase HpnC